MIELRLPLAACLVLVACADPVPTQDQPVKTPSTPRTKPKQKAKPKRPLLVALTKELERCRAQDARARPVVLGRPRRGNAVRDYRRAGRAAKRLSFDETLRALRALHDHKPLPRDVAPRIQANEAARHIRAGLRRRRCDWAFPYEAGPQAPIQVLAARRIANVMRLQAYQTRSAREAVQLGLMIVAFGQDVARHPTMMHYMLGIAVKATGLRSLEATLRRHRLPAKEYARIVRVLASLGPMDPVAFVRRHWLQIKVGLARQNGDPIGPRFPVPAKDPWKGFLLSKDAAARLTSRRRARRAWAGMERFSREARRAARLPPTRHGAASVRLRKKARKYPLARDQLGVALAILRSSVPVDVMQSLVRVLAAAHLYRVARRRFPATLQRLKERLGGELPRDPYRPGQELLSLRGLRTLRVYSWYENGVDDRGESYEKSGRHTQGDLVMSTEVPTGRR